MKDLRRKLDLLNAVGIHVPELPVRALPDSGSPTWDAEQDRAFQLERAAWAAAIDELASHLLEDTGALSTVRSAL